MDFVVFAVFMLIAGASGIAHHRRARAVVEEWAQECGFTLLEADYACPFSVPFRWMYFRNEAVYRVTVADQRGRRRRGFVRCGTWWRDETEVRWDDE